MKSAELLSTLLDKQKNTSNLKTNSISYNLDKFINESALKGRLLNFRRLIGAYFSCAKYSELERGIRLQYNAWNGAITCTYDIVKSVTPLTQNSAISASQLSKKRVITLPIFDEFEYSMAERMFSFFTVNDIIIRGPEKLGVTLNFLRKPPYEIDTLFGMPFNMTSLRVLRLSFLMDKDIGLTREQIWALYLRDFAKYFERTRESQNKATTEAIMKKAFRPPI